MLAKTSVSAIKALIHLGQQNSGTCLSPRRLAETLGESPTYLAKVLRHLVKGGILRAEKGVKGGVRLAMAPEEITLLAVVEACHGAIVGDYCSTSPHEKLQCNFHRAALELHQAITGVLSDWTLADLLKKPRAPEPPTPGISCLMARV
jgi:Rrf2 family protein